MSKFKLGTVEKNYEPSAIGPLAGIERTVRPSDAGAMVLL